MKWIVSIMMLYFNVLYVDSSSGFYTIYCGTENCYDVLNATRNDTKWEISRKYRRLALKYHPDRNKDSKAIEIYNLLTNAYETLKDDNIRKEYDYFLDHPEQRYRNYYMYYQRNVTNYIDVKLVLLGLVVLISICQYVALKQNYDRLLKDRKQDPRLHYQVKKYINEKYSAVKTTKKKKYISLDDKEYEKILESLVKQTYDIKYFATAPEMKELLIYKILTAPYYFLIYLKWCVVWYYNYNLKNMSYSYSDRSYLTKTAIKYNDRQWNALDDDDKESLINLQLWIQPNLEIYNQQMSDYTREQLSKDKKHKIVKRHLKRGVTVDIPSIGASI